MYANIPRIIESEDENKGILMSVIGGGVEVYLDFFDLRNLRLTCRSFNKPPTFPRMKLIFEIRKTIRDRVVGNMLKTMKNVHENDESMNKMINSAIKYAIAIGVPEDISAILRYKKSTDLNIISLEELIKFADRWDNRTRSLIVDFIMENFHDNEILDLSCLKLFEFMYSAAGMPKLKKLFIQNNNIWCISKYIGDFKQLSVLDISHNHIPELPRSIGVSRT